VKVKSKVNKVPRHEDVWGSGDIPPHFLNLGTTWRGVVNFTLQPHYPQRKVPHSHYIGGWVGPGACIDAVAKRKIPSLPQP
jgi:hypothetical protein